MASQVLNGVESTVAIAQANTIPESIYEGGGDDCSGSCGAATFCNLPVYVASNQYPNAGTQVVYDCKIWKSKWWVNPNEIPGENDAWEMIDICNEEEGCGN